VILVEGPFVGRRFRCHRQPFSALWFDEVDSGRYNRHAMTGCVQAGKSLLGYVLPIAWSLFELRETAICCVPIIDLANDKWQQEILPVIERSRYRDLLPRTGEGARGGAIKNAVRFRNGTTLKFMSRNSILRSFTARVVAMTEVDEYDQARESSREADPVSLMEGRAAAFDRNKIIFLECTTTIPSGRIWQEYTGSTESRIVCPCPHCGAWVAPEREHLRGFADAQNALDAGDAAHFVCPACAARLDEDDRATMNRAARLLHRGQEIEAAGRVLGTAPRTDTLGFRFSAFNNLFWSIVSLGQREWKAQQDPDEDNAQRLLKQHVWALPHEPPRVDLTPLTAEAIRRRVLGRLERGVLPPDTCWLTVGIDLGKWLAHYVVVAWRKQMRAHVCEYGVLEIQSDQLGVERGTAAMLNEFRDRSIEGWRIQDTDDRMRPHQVWIDSGWEASEAVVYDFCRRAAQQSNQKPGQERFRPMKGYGATQRLRRHYHAPAKRTQDIREIGEGYHFARLRAKRILLVHVNADAWKTFVHERLLTPADEPGAMTVFAAPKGEHTKFAKHITAEKPVEDFMPGRGTVIVWVRTSRVNHYLDAIYIASAAGHFCGWRIAAPEERAGPSAARKPARAGAPGLTTPDGRPFLITERDP